MIVHKAVWILLSHYAKEEKRFRSSTGDRSAIMLSTTRQSMDWLIEANS